MYSHTCTFSQSTLSLLSNRKCTPFCSSPSISCTVHPDAQSSPLLHKEYSTLSVKNTTNSTSKQSQNQQIQRDRQATVEPLLTWCCLNFLCKCKRAYSITSLHYPHHHLPVASTAGVSTLGVAAAEGGGGAAGVETVLAAVGVATSPPALATDSGGRYSLAVTDSSPGTDFS